MAALVFCSEGGNVLLFLPGDRGVGPQQRPHLSAVLATVNMKSFKEGEFKDLYQVQVRRSLPPICAETTQPGQFGG